MMKILFVCAANMCRSPTAEGIMRKLIVDAGCLQHFKLDSAAVSCYCEGSPPDERSVDCALSHGVDISDLRARQVRADDFAEFDLIVAMDGQNLWNLDMKRPQGDERYQRAKIVRLLEYAPELGEDVPNPYCGDDGFDNVYQIIENSCKNFLESLKLSI